MNDHLTTDDIPDDLPPPSPLERFVDRLPRVGLLPLAACALVVAAAWRLSMPGSAQ